MSGISGHWHQLAGGDMVGNRLLCTADVIPFFNINILF